MKGALIRTLRGSDAALNAGEVGFGEREGFAEGAVVLPALSEFDLVTPDLGFRFGEAAELPVGADEDVDEAALIGRSGLKAVDVFGGQASNEAPSSPGMISDLAWIPDFKAFMAERARPACVRGPVESLALRRLAEIWASEGMRVTPWSGSARQAPAFGRLTG